MHPVFAGTALRSRVARARMLCLALFALTWPAAPLAAQPSPSATERLLDRLGAESAPARRAAFAALLRPCDSLTVELCTIAATSPEPEDGECRWLGSRVSFGCGGLDVLSPDELLPNSTWQELDRRLPLQLLHDLDGEAWRYGHVAQRACRVLAERMDRATAALVLPALAANPEACACTRAQAIWEHRRWPTLLAAERDRLVAWLGHEQFGLCAAKTLLALGPTAAEPVVGIALAQDPAAADHALWLLGHLVPRLSLTQRQELCHALRRELVGARGKEIAWILGRAGAASIPLLIEALELPDQTARMAATALCVNEARSAAMNALQRATRSPDTGLATLALQAIEQIATPDAVAFLLDQIDHGPAILRAFAVELLGWSEAPPRGFGRRIAHLLRDLETQADRDLVLYVLECASIDDATRPELHATLLELGAQATDPENRSRYARIARYLRPRRWN